MIGTEIVSEGEKEGPEITWVRKYLKTQTQLDNILLRTSSAGLIKFPPPQKREPLLLDLIEELEEGGSYFMFR